MKVLVYGAGVIGTLYGAKLRAAGHDVTVLARGTRLGAIRDHGLVIENMSQRTRWSTPVETTDHLGVDDTYDVTLITVRRDQLGGVMPSLRQNRRIGTMLFMLNNPLGSAQLRHSFSRDRIVLGFPGAGGGFAGHVVQYAIVPQQPTTVGTIDGRPSASLPRIVRAFRAAGFPTAISGDMDAWLKTHAFFVTAMCGAIDLAGGDCQCLSNDAATLALMVQGVREGFATLRSLGIPITPFLLKVLFTWLPPAFAIRYWRRFLADSIAEIVFGLHAKTATQEMTVLVNDCRMLIDQRTTGTPALDRLYAART